MSEYEIYTRILAPRLRVEDSAVLIEKTETTKHLAQIISYKKIVYSLYRYDQKEQGDLFFPFFNNTHEGDHEDPEFPAPVDLLKFCDYILLAEKNGKLYVLLIELKSGNNGDAVSQLESTAVFMEYVKASAMRISKTNGYDNFDADNIKVRKIVLKPAPKTRMMTNQAKSPMVDYNAPIIYYPSEILPLYMFCKNE